MNLQDARNQLTREALITTVKVLRALDFLQGRMYSAEFEQQHRKKHPHSESDVFELANQALLQFTVNTPPGNAHGMQMQCSAMINGLKLLNLQTEVAICLNTCELLETS